MLENITLLNSGYCLQLKFLADGQGWGVRRFYAVFIYFEHPLHGAMLIDTGYSEAFFRATQRFPQKLYGWLTPVRLGKYQNAATILASQSLNPADIKTIFISHFHADHIAGLVHFPQAKYVYQQESYQFLSRQAAWSQLQHAFLRDLVPENFRANARPLAAGDFIQGNDDLADFKTLDYYGDGSLVLVALPGHAMGQLGFIFNTQPKPTFYLADACWNIAFLDQQGVLPKLSQQVQYDYGAYQDSLTKLRQLDPTKYHFLACHCPQTQRYVANV